MRYLLSALISSSSSLQSTTTVSTSKTTASWIKEAAARNGRAGQSMRATPVVTPTSATLSANPATDPSVAARWNSGEDSQDSAVVVQKRWGQQCGVSCGCVLRLEIELDAKERVVAALATTKRILVQTNSSNSNGKEPPHHLRPLLTKHRHRPQCTSPSPCRALQALTSAVVHYMPGRYLWQLQNYHEYSSHMRSSGAFCRTVLDQMALPSSPSPLSPSSLQPSNSPPTTMSYTPCFDLVEDALTALLKGYIAAARRTTPLSTDAAGAAAAITDDYNYSTDNWLVTSYHFEFDKKSKSSNKVLGWIQSWWQRQQVSSGWFEASSTTETTSRNDQYPRHHQSLFQTTPVPRNHPRVHNHSTWHNNYWTALDWMDWAEQERALSDQKQAKPSRTLFTDWISYVDTQEQNGRQSDRHEQQSA
jgi:hypothetical protein